MLNEYDIDKLNPRPNPYARELKDMLDLKEHPTAKTGDVIKYMADGQGLYDEYKNSPADHK